MLGGEGANSTEKIGCFSVEERRDDCQYLWKTYGGRGEVRGLNKERLKKKPRTNEIREGQSLGIQVLKELEGPRSNRLTVG